MTRDRTFRLFENHENVDDRRGDTSSRVSIFDCTRDCILHNDALSLSLRIIRSFRLRGGRGWNETWIKYKEWPGFTRTTHPPSSRGIYRGVPLEDGDLVYRGRALPGWFSGESRMHFDPPALSLSRSPLLYCLLFPFSICLSALSFPPWSSRLFRGDAALHPENSEPTLLVRKDDFPKNVYLSIRNTKVLFGPSR